VFFIAHVCLTTTGHTPTLHIKVMIPGWEEVDRSGCRSKKAATSSGFFITARK
jgi:hypothetical protein